MFQYKINQTIVNRKKIVSSSLIDKENCLNLYPSAS